MAALPADASAGQNPGALLSQLTAGMDRVDQTKFIESLPLPQAIKDQMEAFNNENGYRKLGAADFASYIINYIASLIMNILLSFAVIAFFLQPMYPAKNLYQGGNLFFHLIVPVIAMCEFVFFSDEESDKEITFKSTFIAVIPSVVYGFGYILNILINGFGGWPNYNDWYGFLKWGYPVGVGIFAGVILINWIMALIIRGLYLLVRKKSIKE